MSQRAWIAALAAAQAMTTTAQAQDGTPTVEELWAIVQQQQAEIRELRQLLSTAEQDIEDTTERLAQTEQQVEATGSFVETLEAPAASDTTLGAYWSDRLGKEAFLAFQASARGGVVRVRLAADRTMLAGRAVTVSQRERT